MTFLYPAYVIFAFLLFKKIKCDKMIYINHNGIIIISMEKTNERSVFIFTAI